MSMVICRGRGEVVRQETHRCERRAVARLGELVDDANAAEVLRRMLARERIRTTRLRETRGGHGRGSE